MLAILDFNVYRLKLEDIKLLVYAEFISTDDESGREQILVIFNTV